MKFHFQMVTLLSIHIRISAERWQAFFEKLILVIPNYSIYGDKRRQNLFNSIFQINFNKDRPKQILFFLYPSPF